MNKTNAEPSATFVGGRVRVFVGDITRCTTDAIVNAANSTLLGGGGVDGAIHRAGGAKILEECRELRRTQFPNGLPTGQAVITSGGDLPARFVIHTVGPVWGQHGGREAELLTACYFNPLALACAKNLTSIAFPAISTGVYGYPKDDAARVVSRAIEDFLRLDETLNDVRLIFFSASDARMFLRQQDFKNQI
ncbi:MAG: ADP-ribose-binding protein [Pyrinomonadaceae bacterium]